MVQPLRMSKARRSSQTHGFTPTHSIDQVLRVDVVDMNGHGMDFTAKVLEDNNRTNRANPTILVKYMPKWVPDWAADQASAERMITFEPFVIQVTQAVSMMERSIRVLRLWGHANWLPGTTLPAGEPRLGDRSFDAAQVRKWCATFANLKPYFSRHPATRFEFRGCGVAKFGGLDLMKELARLWGIPVHAGENNQAVGNHWDGPVVEARPDGTTRPIVGIPFDALY